MSRSILFLLPLLVGCIKPDEADKGSDDSGGDDSGGGGTTIYDIQTGAVEVDATVTITDVVVTSQLTADGKGFFVQEQEGGEHSGIYVYLQGEFSDLSIYRDDLVTITGTVTEYYDWTEFTVSSVSAIEVTGELSGGAEPASLGDTSGWSAEDWEPWESVLVSLPSQTVTSEVDSYGEANLSAGISMDNLFFDFSTEYGATYTEVIGPIEYNFSEFKIAPRDEDDLQGYTPGEGPQVTSICDIQEQGTYDGMSVQLENVVVTSPLTNDQRGFWVQEQGGGPYCGIYIYIGGMVEDNPDFSVSPGDVLSLSGSVTEYPSDAGDTLASLTEISTYDVEDIAFADTTAEVVATELAGAELPTDAAGWEVYEGVLVTLSDVEITSDESSYGEVETSAGIQLDDALYYYELTDGMSFEWITGLVNFSYEAFELLPRFAEDFSGESGGEGEGEGEGEEMTLEEIQRGVADGSVADGDAVTVLEAVTTSGMTADGRGFFAQDLGGGEWACVYVYVGSSGVSVSAGELVRIEGEVKEYYDLTEIDASSGSVTTYDTEAAPAVVALELSSAPADWEPYEGCLVELADLEVTSDPNTYGESETDWDVLLDDLFMEPSWADGDRYTTVTGPVYYSYSAFRVEPRSAADLVE